MTDATENAAETPPEPANETAGAVATIQPARAPKPPLKAGGRLEAIVPRDLDEAWRFTEAVMHAGMVPKSYEDVNAQATRAKLMIGIMKGLEIGLPPIAALSNIMIVNNRPAVWGDGAMALIQESGQLEWKREWFEGEPFADTWTAHCAMKRRGQVEPYCGQFSVADAKRAKLWGNPKKALWADYPQRMLRWRAFSWPARDGFADVLMGIGIAEEVMDMVPDAPAPVDTSILDDEPATAIEHKPEPPAEAPAERATADVAAE